MASLAEELRLLEQSMTEYDANTEAVKEHINREEAMLVEMIHKRAEEARSTVEEMSKEPKKRLRVAKKQMEFELERVRNCVVFG